MSAPSVLRDSRVVVAVLLCVTFGAGMAAGIAAERLWLSPAGAGSEAPREPSADAPRRVGEEGAGGRPHGEAAAKKEKQGEHGGTVIERFSEELGLTAGQKARIDTILEHFRARMRELRREVRPRYDAVIDSARNRIERVLTEEQARRYRRLLERKRDWDHEGDRER